MRNSAGCKCEKMVLPQPELMTVMCLVMRSSRDVFSEILICGSTELELTLLVINLHHCFYESIWTSGHFLSLSIAAISRTLVPKQKKKKNCSDVITITFNPVYSFRLCLSVLMLSWDQTQRRWLYTWYVYPFELIHVTCIFKWLTWIMCC